MARELSKEEMLDLAEEGLKKALGCGKDVMESLARILDDFENKIYRAAGPHFADQLAVIASYCEQTFRFFQAVELASDKDYVFLEDDGEIKYITRKEYPKYLREKEIKEKGPDYIQ